MDFTALTEAFNAAIEAGDSAKADALLPIMEAAINVVDASPLFRVHNPVPPSWWHYQS